MIKSHLVLCAIACCAADGVANDEVVAGGQPASAQNLFVINGRRVIVIRLHLNVDGTTPQERFVDWSQRAFQTVDRNGDQYLVADELTTGFLEKLGMDGDPWSLDDNPHDKRLSFAELRRWLLRNAGSVRLQTNSQTRTTSDQPLMRVLDDDRNDILTRAEVAGAFEELRKRDIDDSETISLEEMVPGARVGSNNLLAACEFMLVPAGTVRQQLLSKLSRRAESGSVRGRDLRLYGSSTRLKSADFDANGVLDRRELMQFIRDPEPDIELQIDVDTKTGSLQVKTLRNLTNRIEVRTSHGWSRIVIGRDVEVGLIARAPVDPLSAALAMFTARDRDRNGYLDKDERATIPVPQVSSFDTDGDGNVFRNEYEAGFRQMIGRLGATTDVGIDRWGRSLFSAIDTDRNLQLSRREFGLLEARIEAWDANSDGGLAVSEIPDSYQLQIGPGVPAFVARRATNANQQGQPSDPMFARPDWLQRLDRNNDGDLSRREFPGSNEAFNKLDKNRDGFVDLREAVQATSVKPKDSPK